MFSSIKSKLIFSIILLALTSLSILIGIFWYDRQINSLTDLSMSLNNAQLKLQKIDKLQRDFFSYESINPRFYDSGGKSKFLTDNNFLIKEFEENIKKVQNTELISKEKEIDSELEALLIQTKKYQNTFDSASKLIYKKGFEDFGITGKMRTLIHYIENAQNPTLPLDKILMIRRHEKDFIIRKNTKYITTHAQAVELLKNTIQQQVYNKDKRELYIKWLDQYAYHFGEMAELELIIGYTNITGLKGKLNQISEQLNTKLDTTREQLNKKSEQESDRMRVILGSILLVALLVNALLAGLVIQKMGRPIRRLSRLINTLVNNNFEGESKSVVLRGNDELSQLSKDVQFLINSLKQYMLDIQEKADDLLSKNTELEQQQEKIISQRDLLEQTNKSVLEKNNALEFQKKEIDNHKKTLQNQLQEIHSINKLIGRKQSKIIDSITYAKRIQEAMLPDVRSIERTFSDAFVFFKPRDVVSGDLYFLHSTKEQTILAAIDCTGHGVPGALMSMIAFNLLSAIITNNTIEDPAQLLDLLHKGTVKTLKQKKTNNRDGMDATICIHHKDKKEVWFAGAKNKLLYVQKSMFHIIKGDNLPIGGLMIDRERNYTTHKIKVDTPTQFYMFSDGYQDQFGGEQNLKFGSRNLYDLLYKTNHLPSAIQHKHVEETFEKWKGSYNQIDDILVMGFKIE